MTTRIPHAGAAFKTISLALALSAFAATAASAQAAVSEPAYFEALYPYRDVLNGGAPTPAAKLVLQPPEVLRALQAQESGVGVVHVPRHRAHHGRH